MRTVRNEDFNMNIIQKSKSSKKVSLFAMTILILEVVTTLFCVQMMAARWSELIASWPYEISYCIFMGAAIYLLKCYQLYMIGINSRKEDYTWLASLLSIPCMILLTCGLLCCALVKFRHFDEITGAMETKEYPHAHQLFSMMNYNTKHLNKLAWDNVQKKYECCGSLTPEDWFDVRYELPLSCCRKEFMVCHTRNAYQNGCGQKLEAIVASEMQYLEITIYLLLAIEGFMFVIMIAVICKYSWQNADESKTLRRIRNKSNASNQPFVPSAISNVPVDDYLLPN